MATKLNNSTDIGGHGSYLDKLKNPDTSSSDKIKILKRTRDKAILNFNQKLDDVTTSKKSSPDDLKNAEALKTETEKKINEIFKRAIDHFVNQKNTPNNGNIETSDKSFVNGYSALFAFASITKGALSTFLDVRANLNPIDELNDGFHDIDTKESRAAAINTIMDYFDSDTPGFYKQEVDLMDTKK